MTREEAIDIIKCLAWHTRPDEEDVEQAIKALEQQPCEDWYDVPSDEMTLEQARQAVKDLRKKLREYLDQEPCEMTVEEYRNRLMDAFHNADCDELIAVVVRPEESEFKQLEWLLKNHYHNQKQQPCEDAINRQDALNCVTFNEFRYRIVEDIKALPSVTPKGKSEYEHDHDVVKAYNDGQAYILDKIRAEIENDWQFKQFPRSPWSCGLRRALEIIDKYRGE